ncbi:MULTISPECIES: FadR/GntR family transcriptional regulator [Salimicrobium]|uniref:GntR family transcriptional regulator n=1 Tax=Salimicrobium jeotgali TaxID=1230341 RepID=A0AAC8PQX4_9BACI|nr:MULTISPECIES: GntR family transcriptional regulator [Salimicrobium]AKG04139.1 GntR family transcriptional regulator [Salimicrobium jeotgali]MBM7697406.1 DNA-binding FadR family transcriptional regulator [Salimicrobium jeotgali]
MCTLSPNEPEKTKVYEGVLHRLKEFIEEEDVRPGDKLPSERELSDQLSVGRSSIREALRALELLGLIETKRGEGTFLKEYKDYHMINLLSTFILNRNRTREELHIAKNMVEKEIIFLSIGRLSVPEIEQLEAHLVPFNGESHNDLFKALFMAQNQELLLSIWQLLTTYLESVEKIHYTKEWHEDLCDALRRANKEDIFGLYENSI